MAAGALDRKVQFRVAVTTDDGMAVVQTWANTGPVYSCAVVQFGEDEKTAGGQVQAVEMTSFRVRYDSFTSALTPKNRLTYEATEYEIFGRREDPKTRRRYIDFTAAARADLT